MSSVNCVALSTTMNDLQARLEGILASFDRSKRVLYFDYPLHLNIGDLLINLGTEQYFKDNNIDVWRRYFVYDFNYKLPNIDKDVTVIIHGGGNFGDIYPYYQSKREAIFEHYKDNRIVVMPQTVHFSSETAAQDSFRRISSHKNFQIYVRDLESLRAVEGAGIRDVSMMPDMAHALWNVMESKRKSDGHGDLELIRNDPESAPLPKRFELESALWHPCDWDTIVHPFPRILAGFVYRLCRIESLIPVTTEKYRQWYPVRDMAVANAVDYFSKYSTIYSNRLHGAILGALLNKRVIAFDGSYGKISQYFKAWFQETNDIEIVSE